MRETTVKLASPSDTHPAWCVAPHDEDTNFHYEKTTLVPAGPSQIDISLFWDESTNRYGIYVDRHEFSVEQIPALIERLRKVQNLAMLAALAAE